MTDLTELRKLAEAATAGPWVQNGPSKHIVIAPGKKPSGIASAWEHAAVSDNARANAAFIAAANPDAIIFLLDRVDRAEAFSDQCAAIIEQRGYLRGLEEAEKASVEAAFSFNVDGSYETAANGQRRDGALSAAKAILKLKGE